MFCVFLLIGTVYLRLTAVTSIILIREFDCAHRSSNHLRILQSTNRFRIIRSIHMIKMNKEKYLIIGIALRLH